MVSVDCVTLPTNGGENTLAVLLLEEGKDTVSRLTEDIKLASAAALRISASEMVAMSVAPVSL